MRRFILLLLLTFPILWVSAQKADNIFTIAADGMIQPKPVYYNEVKFSWANWLKLQDVSTTTFRTQDQKLYTIQLRKSTGEADLENVFNEIEITYQGKVIYSTINEGLWSNAEFANGSTHQYEVVPLSQTASAVLFFGWLYDSTPPLLTIVVVNKETAKLVFNRHCDILSYEDAKDDFSIVYTDQYQEIPYEGAPLEPADDELNKFKIWKRGGVLKFQKIQ